MNFVWTGREGPWTDGSGVVFRVPEKVVLRLEPPNGDGLKTTKTPPEVGVAVVDGVHIAVPVVEDGPSSRRSTRPTTTRGGPGRGPSFLPVTETLPVRIGGVGPTSTPVCGVTSTTHYIVCVYILRLRPLPVERFSGEDPRPSHPSFVDPTRHRSIGVLTRGSSV